MTRNRSMEMTDDDLELVSQYIAHEMSPVEESAFETKLTNDADFHDRVFPFLDVWYDTDVWPNEPVLEPDELLELGELVELAEVAEVVELVEPATAPVKHIRRLQRRWMGGASALAAAAGIAFAIVQRSGGGPGALPLAAHRDVPASGPVTAVQTTPHKTLATVTHVVAQSDNTFRGAKQALDSAFTKMVAANTDTAAQRVLAELDHLGEPEVRFTPPQVGTVAAAPPIAPKVPFTVLVQSEVLAATQEQIDDPLRPQGPLGAGGAPAGGQGWWRHVLGKLFGHTRTAPSAGIDP